MPGAGTRKGRRATGGLTASARGGTSQVLQLRSQGRRHPSARSPRGLWLPIAHTRTPRAFLVLQPWSRKYSNKHHHQHGPRRLRLPKAWQHAGSGSLARDRDGMGRVLLKRLTIVFFWAQTSRIAAFNTSRIFGYAYTFFGDTVARFHVSGWGASCTGCSCEKRIKDHIQHSSPGLVKAGAQRCSRVLSGQTVLVECAIPCACVETTAGSLGGSRASRAATRLLPCALQSPALRQAVAELLAPTSSSLPSSVSRRE